MANLNEQLKIQQEINTLLKKRSAMMKEQASQLTGQAKLAKELCKALDCKDLDDMEDRLKGINDELKEAANNATKTEGEIDALAEATKKADTETKSLAASFAKVGAAVGGIKGVISVFKGLNSIISGAASLIGTVVSGIFNIGKSILSIPFGIYQGLLGMAQQGGGGPSPIKLQLEEIRDAVGSLATNEGKSLRDSMMGARDSFKKLGVEGVSFGRIFGYGPGGVAEAGKAFLEIATALGPKMSMLTDLTKKNQMAMVIYSKGLGLSADQMASLATVASAAGEKLNDFTTKVASFAINMGKEFGINTKLISKDMGAMMEDFANFGRLGPKVMAAVAVQTRRLGFEAKELVGMIDKFDNFEDAAQAASKLNQVFGIQIDTMGMLKEQDPAARLSMMQKAFEATGKSVENMNRQELKLLASQTGLSEKAAALAFSQKGLAMSYDDVMAGADDAEGKQLSQAEAMKELSDSIKKTFGGGGGKQFKGFFDAFVQGFGKGIRRSKEFRKIMRNIRKSLRAIFRAGKQVGKNFVKFFPGVKTTFKGLGKLFDPKKFKKLGKGLIKVFTDMFKRMRTDPKGGARAFFKDIQKLFKNFFSSQSPAIKMIKSGAKRFGKAMSELVAEGIRFIKPKIIDGLKSITEFIKDPSGFIDAAAAGGSFIAEIFQPIIEAITEGEGPDSGVTGAFKELLTTLWDKIGPDVEGAVKKFAKYYLVTALVTIVLKALAGAAVGALVGGITGFVKKVLGGAQQQTESVRIEQFTQAPTKTLKEQIEDLASISATDIGKATLNLGIIGLGFMGAMAIFFGALYGAAQIVTISDLAKMGLIMITVTPPILAITALAMAIAKSGTTPGEVLKSVGIIGVAGLVIAAIGGLSAAVALAFKAADVSAGTATQAVAVTAAMTGLALAVAAGGALLGAYGPAMPLIAIGTLVIGLAGAMVTAIGALGALGATAFKGVDPAQVDMFVKIVDSLVPLAIVTAVGAAAIGTALAATLGVGAALIVAGMVTLGEISDEMGDWVKGFTNKFSDVSKADTEKALIAAEAAVTLVKGAAFALDEAMSAGLSTALGSVIEFFTGSNPIDEGLEALSDVMETMAKYIPKMMKDMIEAVRGAPPEKVKEATDMLEKIMKALQPMIEVQKMTLTLAAMQVASSPKEIAAMFKSMDDFVSGPIKQLGSLLDSIKEMATDMEGKDLEGIKAMGSLLGSIASVIGAITGPLVALIKAANTSKTHLTKDGGFTGDDEFSISKDFDEDKFDKAMKTMGKHVGTIVGAIGTAVQDLIKALPDMPADGADAKKLTDFANALGPAAKALGSFIGGIDRMMKGGGKEILEKLTAIQVKNAAKGAITEADHNRKIALLRSYINSILFPMLGKNLAADGQLHDIGKSGGLIGMMGHVARALSEVDIGEATNLEAKSKVIGAMGKIMGDFVGIIRKMAGVTGQMPKPTSTADKKKQLKIVTKFMKTSMKVMITQIKSFLDMIIPEMDKFFTGVKSEGQIKKLASKVKIFGSIFSTINPIVDMVGSMMSAFGGAEGKKSITKLPKGGTTTVTKAKDFTKFGRDAKGFIENIVGALTGEKGIGAIIKMFTGEGSGKNRTKGLIDKVGPRTFKVRSRLKTLVEIMKVVGDITSMISDLQPMMTVSQFTDAGLGDKAPGEGSDRKLGQVEYILRMIPTMFGANGEKLDPIINVIKGVLPKMKGISVPRNIDKIMAGITGIAGLALDDDLAAIAEGKAKGMSEAGSTKVSDAMTQLNTQLGYYKAPGRTIAGLMGSLPRQTTIDAVAAKIASIDNIISTEGSKKGTVAAAFKSGKLLVSHSFPKGINAQIGIEVNLNGKKLAKGLKEVTFNTKKFSTESVGKSAT